MAGANKGKVAVGCCIGGAFLQLVAALAELEDDKRVYKETNKEKKEQAKRDKASKAELEAFENQGKCVIALQKVASKGADSLKRPELVLLLKHHYMVKVTAAMKVAELKDELLTYTLAVAANIEYAASGVGATLEGVDYLSSDDDDDEVLLLHQKYIFSSTKVIKRISATRAVQ